MERWILAPYLAAFATQRLVQLVLNELNLRSVAAVREPERRKAVEYTSTYGRFSRWTISLGGLLDLALLFWLMPWVARAAHGLAARLPVGARAEGLLFLSGMALAYDLVNIPMDLWATFVIEERFGFNRTGWRLYLADLAKGWALDAALGIPMNFCGLWLMERGGPLWWLWAFLGACALKLLLTVVYPLWIAPLFNEFNPLPEGGLKDRVVELARRVGFRFESIFVMDGSRRSGHSNAYFTGFGRFKRIVFYDTMIAELTAAQNAAVFCHELGHWKLRHALKHLALALPIGLVGFYVLDWARGFASLYSAFGIPPSSQAALFLIPKIFGKLTFFMAPVWAALSRRDEAAADRFAKETLGGGEDLASALLASAGSNLENPAPHPWYRAYYYSHPTTAERAAALRAPA